MFREKGNSCDSDTSFLIKSFVTVLVSNKIERRLWPDISALKYSFKYLSVTT